MTTSTNGRSYAYSNDSGHATDHHEALAAVLDPATQRRITGLLGPLRGLRCADVGAGAGTLAVWMAINIGSQGYALATDINTTLIPRNEPGLSVVEHDITRTILPGAPYDLVHARLLLNHLPQRVTALANLVVSLRPGGVLVTADFLPARPADFVVSAPTGADESLLQRVHAMHMQLLREAGTDRLWSQHAPQAMTDFGLQRVERVVHGGTWTGRSPGCRLLAAGLRQLQPRIQATGFSSDSLERVFALLEDPTVEVRGHELHSASGWMPE